MTSEEKDVVLLDGGPMHGRREISVDVRGFSVRFNGRDGYYEQVGRNEAGLRIFKWRLS